MKNSTNPLIKHIPKFLEYIEVEKGLSQATSRNYHNFLLVFIEWLKDNKLDGMKPHELTPDHIWNYRLYLSRKKDKEVNGQLIKKTTQS
ncbi:MAG: site-specific integrase [Patescibacteria group bacterium]|jgi:site-specific recombinase XerD